MHVKNRKTITEEKLRITLRMYVDEVSLELDENRCLKCDICAAVCPKDSITIINQGDRLAIDIDEKTCVLCEVCSHFCPNGSIVLRQNGIPKNSLLVNEGLPPFPSTIEIDASRCPQGCEVLEEKESHWCREQQKLVESLTAECPKNCHLCIDICPGEILTKEEGTLRFDRERCLRCIQCEDQCELGAISVNPVVIGEICLEDAKCPEDCNKCIDLCPTRAIHREGRRVFVEDRYCIFCGVCTNICDQEAITLVRKGMEVNGEGACAAWTHALERLFLEVGKSHNHRTTQKENPPGKRQGNP
jgi:4Fe-4S ferredoxin